MRKLLAGVLLFVAACLTAVVATASMASATVYVMIERSTGNVCGSGGDDDGVAGAVHIYVDRCLNAT